MNRFKRKINYCFYGCGQVAKYQFKNKRWCCEVHQNKCPNRKNFKEYFKKIASQKPPMCACGCGKETKWNEGNKKYNIYFYNHHTKGSNNPMYGKLGKNHPAYGHVHTTEIKIQISETHKRKIFNGEIIKPCGKNHPSYGIKRPDASKYMKNGGSAHANSFISDEERKRQSERMKGGMAAYCNSFIQNPSKPQKLLFKKVHKIYPNAILNYPSSNKSIDIAIPNLMIAIEYDGSYWHQGRENEDKIRQQELENIGWQFLRYVDYIPKMDELKRDLRLIINGY